MLFLSYPDISKAAALLARPTDENAATRREKVAALLESIRLDGDVAVRQLTMQFDGFLPEQLELLPAEIDAAESLVSLELQTAIRQAYANLRAFHAVQREELPPVETVPGVVCWRKSLPIERVGLYIPGGTAPLFSTVLMLGVPAQIAGCQQVILCTPPQRDGSIHPAVLFAARLCGIRRIFRIGGVQAIGAMAYGTASVPKVWKIFGPGNGWVTTAKQLVSLSEVAIDMPAGPSEMAILADATANPRFVAADLLSQAEHGADSQVVLVTDHAALIPAVEAELQRQLATLPRRALAEAALQHSKALLVKDLPEGIAWINAYAPEHLLLQVEHPAYWAAQVVNAGSVFLGAFTPESAGDYASGTNHTLPTSGYARAYAGVSLDSFVRKVTFQQITRAGLERLGPTVVAMAEAEGLEAHARAVQVRLEGRDHK
ncbi:MAG: histidinol dehydrogenase [Saprospiraceae bacterium]|nr:histidinol dehydrogenase [Saprospiraceae bacterium]